MNAPVPDLPPAGATGPAPVSPRSADAAALRVRSLFGFGLVLGAFGVLLGRLAWLQLAREDRWDTAARAQHYVTVRELPAERGAILDRNGEVLARTERLPSIAVDPVMVKDKGPLLASLLERHLRVPRATTLGELAKPGRFRWIRRHERDRAAVDRLRDAVRTAEISGVVFREEPRRVYPFGTLAAHVVGFTDRDGKGLEGIERLRNAALAGTPGRSQTLRDASGVEILTAARPYRAPVPGEDVRLTIDLAIQSFCEQAAEDAYTHHQADGVTVAVLDVRTGELLGCAVRPTFDPNDPSRVKPESRRNRFFSDTYEPGSVFKPIVLLAALEAGKVGLTERFLCDDGCFRVGGRVIHEDKHKRYGMLDLRGIVAHSSNTGMAQIGDRLGIPGMKEALATWGFGRRTAVGWPAEEPGDVQPRAKWTRGDQLMSVSFGHAMTATPAQILNAYGTIANGGTELPMRILADAPPAPGRRVCGPEIAGAMGPMLEAVLSEEGTANWVYKEKDYRIGGKTGTAQKLKTGGHVASFACIGPIEDPRLAVLVMADEPRKNGYYGSTVAAKRAVPVLRASLRTLGIDPSGGEGRIGSLDLAPAQGKENPR